MKRPFFIVCTLLVCLASSAQDKVQSVSLELLGAHTGAGINYDTRFKGNSGLGYRVGIGYSYSVNDYFFGDEKIKGIGAPVELNYLFGKKNHKLEVGVGTSLGVYHRKEEAHYYFSPTPEYPDGLAEDYFNEETLFGYFLFGDIGYRYQRPHGFVFRSGFSPSLNFGDKYGMNKDKFYPYIGLGWSF